MSPDPAIDLREAVRAHAGELGFSLVGFTSAEPLAEGQQIAWRRWREQDQAGAMQYLMRESPRRTHPRDLLPEARTAIVVGAAYYPGDHPPPPEGEGACGKVARYAWGRDYHVVLRERLNQLGEWIGQQARDRQLADSVSTRPCVDSAPLDERALAVRAGLGFIGKNTLLLNAEHGSYFLLGVLLVSLELPADVPGARDAAASCGACRRCLEACPTAAFDDAYRLDPRRCTSYLTIEQREEIPAELATRMEGWAFGCDICQEVCPFNARPLTPLVPEFAAAQGVGPHFTEAMLEASPSGKAFQRRWAGTPLERPGRKGLARNLKALRPSTGENSTHPKAE